MTVRLFIEGSYCPHTMAAGWGVYAAVGNVDFSMSGPMPRFDSLTKAELAATRDAFYGLHTAAFLPQSEDVTICLRSMAALAVLRWVFPDAEFEGHVLVNRPKRLMRNIKTFEPLFELDDIMEQLDLKPRLHLVTINPSSERAAALARQQMLRVRGH